MSMCVIGLHEVLYIMGVLSLEDSRSGNDVPTTLKTVFSSVSFNEHCYIS